MSYKINSLEQLKDVVWKKWSELDIVPIDYLSDKGVAAKEAFRCTIWYLGFYDHITEIKEDDEFMNLINIPDKHPEYYNVLRKVYHAIERIN